jgi:hypothetical protein
MPLIEYVPRNFSPGSQRIIDQANEIITVYAQQGYDLTLRQLYYQFVSRDLIPNKQSEYKRLGSIINDARLAGQIDWNHITDRTRNLEDQPHWKSPSHIVEIVANQYRIDKWAKQPFRIEVWIEKDALAGVFDRVCKELEIPYFSCRGYTSQSEMWAAAQRLLRHERRANQETIILHFGDHDPSGIDMTRDIRDRLHMFGSDVDIRRLALTRDQIDQYNPPPNPAKTTDARYERYEAEHGDESWELDALEPEVLANLVRDEVETLREDGPWETSEARENKERALLTAVSKRWEEVADLVEDSIEEDANEDEGEEDDE